MECFSSVVVVVGALLIRGCPLKEAREHFPL
jgi:hypothetical protein